jgi:hypothetical protein
MSVTAANLSEINNKRPGKIGVNIISSQMIAHSNEFVTTPQSPLTFTLISKSILDGSNTISGIILTIDTPKL